MNYNPFSLEGKTILVTGASSGIGRATAIECSRMGAKVIGTARNEERLQETLTMMEGEGHIMITADLCEENDIQHLIGEISAVDGVVNVAGGLNLKALKFYSEKNLNNLFKINTFSSTAIIRYLLKQKKLNKKSSLVFISSVASQLSPSAGNGIYSMTKAAIEAYSRQCAVELMDKEIRSNIIQPGMIDTDLIIEASAYYRAEDEKQYIGGHYGKPSDVAKMVVYLLSDAASFVTGASFVIDGGRNLSHFTVSSSNQIIHTT